jgi:hypothetical protein
MGDGVISLSSESGDDASVRVLVYLPKVEIAATGKSGGAARQGDHIGSYHLLRHSEVKRSLSITVNSTRRAARLLMS